ncbi:MULTISPECIES: 50S ribosomal protein L30 [unclassified Nitrosomonas]|uniref:50S ribosomal protein L30 n=1 Tax=unclassified Nitrosomonas TaxID=2609265 RepID=UPI00089A7EEA|nr:MULTISPECIES: 50S ribosomal protein L30 [unclassified Nitrosomonas]MDV6344532.1 50S ribosomal protein L30 [Nitrosomonas sp. Is37]SDY22599.1 large subunit ribosomal protein L30 [Nitrosomonas sp. Nm33]
MTSNDNKKLCVKLVKSLIGKRKSHRRIIEGLGLKRINSIAILQDSPSLRGMINKVSYMVKVEQ